jgi:hypothetical protein
MSRALSGPYELLLERETANGNLHRRDKELITSPRLTEYDIYTFQQALLRLDGHKTHKEWSRALNIETRGKWQNWKDEQRRSSITQWIQRRRSSVSTEDGSAIAEQLASNAAPSRSSLILPPAHAPPMPQVKPMECAAQRVALAASLPMSSWGGLMSGEIQASDVLLTRLRSAAKASLGTQTARGKLEGNAEALLSEQDEMMLSITNLGGEPPMRKAFAEWEDRHRNELAQRKLRAMQLYSAKPNSIPRTKRYARRQNVIGGAATITATSEAAPNAPAPLTPLPPPKEVCRLCKKVERLVRGKDPEKLVRSTCNCRAQAQSVHLGCLDDWLAGADTQHRGRAARMTAPLGAGDVQDYTIPAPCAACKQPYHRQQVMKLATALTDRFRERFAGLQLATVLHGLAVKMQLTGLPSMMVQFLEETVELARAELDEARAHAHAPAPARALAVPHTRTRTRTRLHTRTLIGTPRSFENARQPRCCVF